MEIEGGLLGFFFSFFCSSLSSLSFRWEITNSDYFQMTEHEMAGWHHQLNGHEFEHAPGFGDGQGRLVCCSPWGCKESDTTEQLN